MPSPSEPESLEQTGLAEAAVEQLIVKILYSRGELYGQDLSKAIGLRYSVIQGLVDALKIRHHVQVKRSLGMGDVGALLSLTEAGRARAREYMEANLYAGPAPVPMTQYTELVHQQRRHDGWLTKNMLRKALQSLVVTEHVLSQIGPAISAGNSMLLYGKPGDGKSFLAESLNNLEAEPIFVPHAIECQGNIVQVYDPVYHVQVSDEATPIDSIAVERSYDHRWAKCRRPFIMSGGELTLDMLDLSYNHTSKVYEAPFQLKANNGIYLVDDFGRQRASAVEVLNRWIVPMERRVDYLSFITGGKMTVPFETFLIFSTNLNPADLGDEAFLRRIQYKMLLRGPAENEFVRIFENFCRDRDLPCSRDLVEGFLSRHYRGTGRPLRRCQPRDVLTHALNLMHFEKLSQELTGEILERAFESCFLQEDEAAPDSAALMAQVVPSCADFWSDKMAQPRTAFGALAFTAGFFDRVPGKYFDEESAREYGEAETSRVLTRLHLQAFARWLGLTLSEQGRDLERHLSARNESASKMHAESQALAERLTPPGAKPEEAKLFAADLATVLEMLGDCEDPKPERAASECLFPVDATAINDCGPVFTGSVPCELPN